MLQERATDMNLPHNLEAERSVLGALFVDREAIIRVRSTLQPEDFYRPAHREIYAAIIDLYDRRVPPDQATVADELERREQLESVGGIAYLFELPTLTPTAAHVESYAEIVRRESTRRKLIQVGGNIVRLGYDDGAEVGGCARQERAVAVRCLAVSRHAGFQANQPLPRCVFRAH